MHRRIALAALLALSSITTAGGQAPPFNATSISTLGGACSTSGAIVRQLAGGVSECLAPGTDGSVLKVSGGVPSWAVLPGTGTVSSVGLALPSMFSVTGSPVTSTGTLTGSLASQSANLVFASPNGASGAPTFRTLNGADFPTTVVGPAGSDFSFAAPTGQLFRFGSNASTQWSVSTAGTLYPDVDGTTALGAATKRMSTIYANSLDLSGSQTANTVYAAPNGTAGAPTFRALSGSDLPTTVIGPAGSDFSLAAPAGYSLRLGSSGALQWTLSTTGVIYPNTDSVTDIGTSAKRVARIYATSLDLSGSQPAKAVYAAPTGTVGAPSFRALVAADVSGLGTAALANTGTSAGNVVALDGAAKLPAVDGSQLTNVSSIGVGQTWQTVTRTSGTSYQNTTGKPIMVSATSAGSCYINVSTDNSTWVQVAGTAATGSFCTTIVPNTHYYKLTLGGTPTVAELR